MSKQVSLFSYFGSSNAKRSKLCFTPTKNVFDDTTKVVQCLLKNLVDEVAKTQSEEKKNALDEVMSKEKIEKWQKKFTFWDTPDGKVFIFIYCYCLFVKSIHSV